MSSHTVLSCDPFDCHCDGTAACAVAGLMPEYWLEWVFETLFWLPFVI